MQRLGNVWLMLALSLGAGIAVAAEPGSDHPLVGRFEGAMMTRYAD